MGRKSLSKERIGTISRNNLGSLMEVVEYKNKNDIWVKFVDYGNLVNTRWEFSIDGNVKNPYDKSVHGVGYIGEGEYKPTINGKMTPQYSIWRSILGRGYSELIKKKNPTYKDCSVCDEWHNFQTFAKWYDENYYEVAGEKMNLDKDILFKWNKLYSPETCVFVPCRINSLFIKCDSKRGDSPVGVSYSEIEKKYVASCSKGSNMENKRLGSFETADEAFNVYKSSKENFIKHIAEEYRYIIPNIIYEAMMKYEVEIDD